MVHCVTATSPERVPSAGRRSLNSPKTKGGPTYRPGGARRLLVVGNRAARRLHTIRSGHRAGRATVLLSSAVVVVGALVAVVVLTGAFAGKGSAPGRQAEPTPTTTTAAEAERQLISDVTMVPLNGSTGQSHEPRGGARDRGSAGKRQGGSIPQRAKAAR